jgi:ribosomal protein S7
MIKSIKDNKAVDLKTKIVNSLMISGRKETGEKILLKFVKLLQKSANKNFKSLIQLAIISSTPTFKLNEQVMKKGKRKATKSTPSFIPNDSFRVKSSLKIIRTVASKNKGSTYFYESLVKEILASANLKSQSVDKKNELQNQILTNKRYLSKFRW